MSIFYMIKKIGFETFPSAPHNFNLIGGIVIQLAPKLCDSSALPNDPLKKLVQIQGEGGCVLFPFPRKYQPLHPVTPSWLCSGLRGCPKKVNISHMRTSANVCVCVFGRSVIYCFRNRTGDAECKCQMDVPTKRINGMDAGIVMQTEFLTFYHQTIRMCV